MKSTQTTPKNMDEYIAGFPDDVQTILQKVRMTIRRVAPNAQETISYKIPTFKMNGAYLIYFAGYKKHIAIYPVPTVDEKFNQEISAYQAGKGTLQFPLDKPIPYKLITRIVKFSIQDNLAKAAAKSKSYRHNRARR